MNDSSIADKINKWQILIENIRDVLPEIPGADPWYGEITQKVEAFRKTQEKVLILRGQLQEAMVARELQQRETQRALRRLAATARAHFGFNNPLLETFNIRSEHRARRGRKPAVKKPAPQS